MVEPSTVVFALKLGAATGVILTTGYFMFWTMIGHYIDSSSYQRFLTATKQHDRYQQWLIEQKERRLMQRIVRLK